VNEQPEFCPRCGAPLYWITRITEVERDGEPELEAHNVACSVALIGTVEMLVVHGCPAVAAYG